jgi:hypothetical protein
MNDMQEVYQLYRVINELRTLLQEMISLVFVNKKISYKHVADVDGRIILRWMLRKWVGFVGTGWSGLRIGTGGGHL